MAVPCAPRSPFTAVTGGGLDSARLCFPVPLVLDPPPPSLGLDVSLFFPNVNLPRRFAKVEDPLLEVETLEAWACTTGFGWGGVTGKEEANPTDTAIAFTEFTSGPAIAPEGVRRGIRSGAPEGSGSPEGGSPSTG